MRRGGSAVAVPVALALGLVALAPDRPAHGNGEVQREVHGRVVSVDARAGTLAVAREFRGKTTRLTLQGKAPTPVYACDSETATLDRVKAGMTVSVFYEVVGAEGVANLVVLPPVP